jgi:hypothetical protein
MGPGRADNEDLPVASRTQGLELFREEHGRYPDLVVLHSNYWDVAQIVLFREGEALEEEYVRLMRPWLDNAAKVANFLQVRAHHCSCVLHFGRLPCAFHALLQSSTPHMEQKVDAAPCPR